jgi:hypothetical protein
MSSRWNHALCTPCFRELMPDREPFALVDPQNETCCRCGNPTNSGIYYRANPNQFPCRGVHDDARITE